MEDKLQPFQKEYYEDIRKPWIQQSGLDEHIFAKEVSFCVQHIQNNPYLKNCSPQSFLKAVLNIAQCGLTLNPIAKEAYLVPRRINNSLECVLDPSYMGLNKLLTDSGAVNHSSAVLIWEGDEIEVNMADTKDPIKKHVPYFITGNDQGEIKGVYDVATLPNGDKHTEFMSNKDILEIMEYSETVKAIRKFEKSKDEKDHKKASGMKIYCPWFKDFGEMARKTVSKRHWKRLPKSKVESDRFDNAVHFSNIASGYDEPVGFEMMSRLETKMIESGLDDPHHRGELGSIETQQQALKFLRYLESNIQPIGTHRTPHKITEMSEAVKNAVEKDDIGDKRT